MFKSGLPPKSPWRKYQKVQWEIAFTNLMLVGVAILLVIVAPEFYSSKLELWAGAIVAGVPNIAAGYWLGNFPCPRCHRPFFTWWAPIRVAPRTDASDPVQIALRRDDQPVGIENGRVKIDLSQNSTSLAQTCRNCGLPKWHDA